MHGQTVKCCQYLMLARFVREVGHWRDHHSPPFS